MNAHVTRRYFVRGLGLFGASVALATLGAGRIARAKEKPSPLLAIIHTNDTHGHDTEVEATENTEGNFSMAAVAQLKADWTAKGYDVLLVDAGDATQGTTLVDQSKGETGISFMNSCGYDLMTAGNHEFDRGSEEIDRYEELAEFPIISANVILKETGDLRFSPNKVFVLSDGTKVGLFGLTTPETMSSAMPSNVAPFDFLTGADLYDCAQQQVDDLRAQGCDIVICLGHLGNAAVCEPNRSRDVLENVTGIDLFIDGHDHQLVEEEVEGTLLVETGCYLHNIGVVVIDDGIPASEGLPYGSYDGIDPATKAIIDDVDAQVAAEMGLVIAHTDFFLDGNRSPGLRTQETNLGDLCLDAFLWGADQAYDEGVDAAIWNGGGIRSSVEQGDISLATIKGLVPFNNQVMVVKVTGAQLLEALEAATQSCGTDEPIGSFPQVAGMSFIIDASVPYEKGAVYPNSTYASPANPGARVTIVDVGGRGFSPTETYTIAASDFICQGGDTYHTFKDAADALTPVICGFDYEIIAGYLIGPCDHEVPDAYREAQGRITIVG